jgi:hypothetical protein
MRSLTYLYTKAAPAARRIFDPQCKKTFTTISAISGLLMHRSKQTASLFDHLVGECENFVRKIETNGFGGLEVDNERQLGRLLDGKIGRRGTL